jgi:hypothetical protein
MAHRKIEETFQAIKPRGSRGVPAAPTIGVGVSSGGDLSSSLSQAGQQIAQLQSVYERQAALITANTQALQGNTSAQSGHSTAANVASTASSFLGGGLGLLSPIVSGIAKLFGAGESKPAPLPIYIPPAPVQIDGTLRSSGFTAPGVNQSSVNQSSPASSATATPTPAARESAGTAQSSPAAHVTINVNAMDSQSFMDRSSDIASAVREAMLNLHPINDVVANL